MATDTTILHEVKTRSAWSVFMGLLTAALGILLIVYPFATATLTTVLLGGTLILVGAAGLVLALASQTAGSFFRRILLAALYALTGIALVAFPFQGVESVTLLVGVMLLLRGAVGLGAAVRLRPVDGWGWLLAEALVSVLAGVLVLARWPSSAFWAVGTLVGASVLTTGLSRIAMAARIGGGAGDLEKLARAP